MNTCNVHTARKSPALNGSSTTQHCCTALNGGLPQVLLYLRTLITKSWKTVQKLSKMCRFTCMLPLNWF